MRTHSKNLTKESSLDKLSLEERRQLRNIFLESEVLVMLDHLMANLMVILKLSDQTNKAYPCNIRP
jgi:hypothetical protein